jgi:hypothetical protein
MTVWLCWVAPQDRRNLSSFIGVDVAGDRSPKSRIPGVAHLFAPAEVIGGAEAVLKAIVEVSLKPSVELRQLALQSLSKSPDPDPFLRFRLTCRTDLDNERRTLA